MKNTYLKLNETSSEFIYELENNITVRIPRELVTQTMDDANELFHNAKDYLYSNDRELLEKISLNEVVPTKKIRKDILTISNRYEEMKDIIPPIFKPEFESDRRWKNPETGIWYKKFPTVDSMVNIFSMPWHTFEEGMAFVSPTKIPYILTFAAHAYGDTKDTVKSEIVERVDEYYKFRDEDSKEYVLDHISIVFEDLESKLKGLDANKIEFYEDVNIDILNRPFWYAFLNSEFHNEFVGSYIDGFIKEYKESDNFKDKHKIQNSGIFRNIERIVNNHTSHNYTELIEDLEKERSLFVLNNNPDSLTPKDIKYIPENTLQDFYNEKINEIFPTFEDKINFEISNFKEVFGFNKKSVQGKKIYNCFKRLTKQEFNDLSDKQKGIILENNPYLIDREDLVQINSEFLEKHYGVLVQKKLPTVEEKIKFEVKNFKETFGVPLTNSIGQIIDSYIKKSAEQEFKTLSEDQKDEILNNTSKQKRYLQPFI